MVLRQIFVFALAGFFIVSCSSSSDSGKVTDMKEDTGEPPTEDEVHAVYTINCVSCHGVDGKLKGSGAADLSTSKMSDKKILEMINNGNDKGMMPYEDVLTQGEREGLVEYVKSLRE